jgi:hypothetical protein
MLGLHEDLNRIKVQATKEAKRGGRQKGLAQSPSTITLGTPRTLRASGQMSEAERSDESWRRHTERKSIVVDLFQGMHFLDLDSVLDLIDCFD